MALTLDTPIVEFHRHGISKLSAPMARKLALAVAGESAKSDPAEATVEDLLNYFPMRYEDRSSLLQIDQLHDGIEGSVELFTRVSGGFQVGKHRSPKSPPLFIFEITGSDPERTKKPVVVWWFISGRQASHIINYYKERFDRGTRFVAYGKWEWDSRRNTFALNMKKPDELEVLPPVDGGSILNGLVGNETDPELGELDNTSDPEFAMIHTARRVPIYRKLGPFMTKRLREIMFGVIQALDKSSISESLPDELLKEHKLIPRAEALIEIHFPPEDSTIIEYESFRSRAHRRLIFEEFFWLVFTLQLIRGERQKEPKGTVIEMTPTIDQRMRSIAPFALTGAQDRVIGRIIDDLISDAPMNRLIQGDVGSGKTIVAFMAMFAAVENGYQAALMAPTEILAEQHARNAERIFSRTPYKVGLLRGSMKAAEKRKVQEAIASGEIQIVIGTHAVIQDAVTFDKLGLAVIDEQHRFGVLQRSALRDLGYNPDVLVMTATPIPRSLAMTVYGDLDVSVIDELPPGRTPIKTVVLGEDQRRGVYRGLERAIDRGRQVYFVYPLI